MNISNINESFNTINDSKSIDKSYFNNNKKGKIKNLNSSNNDVSESNILQDEEINITNRNNKFDSKNNLKKNNKTSRTTSCLNSVGNKDVNDGGKISRNKSNKIGLSKELNKSRDRSFVNDNEEEKIERIKNIKRK